MADLLEKNQQLIIYYDLYGPLLTENNNNILNYIILMI